MTGDEEGSGAGKLLVGEMDVGNELAASDGETVGVSPVNTK